MAYCHEALDLNQKMHTKSYNPPKPLDFAAKNEELQKIIANVERLKNIDKFLCEMLEPEWIEACKVANYQNGCLTLRVENAAFATPLRYQVPQLTEQLRVPDKLPDLASIKIIVRSEEKEPPVIHKKELAPSKKNAEIVAESAKNIADKDLQAALVQLSETLKNGSCPSGNAKSQV